ncbi:hypothetical protein Pla110_07050 [Polystyrenella longa]|uniref:Uncharacterized protein n=2 Tax=Polystyrenella longa TaxID=2528007 RepID=A0A518CIE8_9PLAN|nr:hypothetical protein Pla110_07050 [Polystyrenella longa]
MNVLRRSLLCTGLFTLVILLTCGPILSAQEKIDPPPASEAASEATVDVSTDETGLTAEQREKKEGTLVGIMMITLICITGVFLIIWILLYGRWFRRMTRHRTGPVSPPDPLWYLKEKPNTEKPGDETSNSEESNTAEPTPPEEDDDTNEEKPSS